MWKNGTIASAIMILGATACVGSCGNNSGGNGDGGSASGKPVGYTACDQRYFSQVLDRCSIDTDCGALTCRTPSNCTACSDRCRGAKCDTSDPVSSCAGFYDNLCTQSSSDPFYFTCYKANSLDEPQCTIMRGYSSGGCTTPPVYNCGTSAAGTIPCPAGKVCCLSPGCDSSALDPYKGNGAVSNCSTPVASNGGSAQCPSPAIQLCANNSACPAGYRCDPMKYYCIPA